MGQVTRSRFRTQDFRPARRRCKRHGNARRRPIPVPPLPAIPRGYVIQSDAHGIMDDGYPTAAAARRDLPWYRRRFPHLKFRVVPASEANPSPVWVVVRVQGDHLEVFSWEFDQKVAVRDASDMNKMHGRPDNRYLVMKWVWGLSPDMF